MFTQIISAILAVAKAVPVIEKYLDQLLTAYAKQRKKKIIEETIEAVDVAINTGDQRPLEAPEHSGVYSGHGTIRKPPTE